MSDPKNTKAVNKTAQTDYTGRTIYILYVPGGGVQGIIPGVILSRLEELTETPTSSLFQVLNGVSTGALITGGISIRSDTDATKPRYLASNIAELFCYWSDRFFPHIPNRFSKYLTDTMFNYIQDSTNPALTDKHLIRQIRLDIQDLNQKNNYKPAIIHDLIQIRHLASEKYFSKRTQRRASKACEALMKHDDVDADMKETLSKINTFILARRPIGFFSTQFNKAANAGMNTVKRLWATNFMYDPSVLENMLKDHLGDARMSDALRSLYISSYDLESRRMCTFFNRKADFFSNDPNLPSETSEHDEKIWDAIMASAANPFAYPPHKTEDGRICSDKAILHTPLPCVEDVLKHKPDGVNVKLVFAGTGKTRYDTDHDGYDDYNVLRSLFQGRELDDLYRYNTSTARDLIREKLGAENFIDFDPYTSAAELNMLDDMPSPPNSMDASPENVQKILKLARDYIQEEEVDQNLKTLALEMSENLYKLGQISEKKWNRIQVNCGQKNPSNDNQKTPTQSSLNRRIGQLINTVMPHRWYKP